MKIIQVQTQATAAGAQRISDLVGEGLAARGHQVRTVFMYRQTGAYDADPTADIIMGHNPRGVLDQVRAAAGLVAYLRRHRPDAVITYQYWGNLFGALGARLAGVDLVIANQSGAPMRSGLLGLVSRLDRVIGARGAYRYNIVNSDWTRTRFDDYPKAYRDRLRLIPHGAPRPGPLPDKEIARTRFGLPQGVPLIVSSGRLSVHKNQQALVGALAGLDGVHLALAGTGPARDTLAAIAAAGGYDDRLHFVGEVPRADIFDFLAAGDVFAFASLGETFGLSVVEAAIVGLPLVVTDLAVFREVLNGQDGSPAALFARTPDGEGFEAALARLMTDPALAETLSRSGRTLAQKYDPEAMVAGYAALLSPGPAHPAKPQPISVSG